MKTHSPAGRRRIGFRRSATYTGCVMTAILPPIDLTPGTILGDEVYSRIGAAILDGRLAPGQRLRDVDLAAQLGVSRTPVREALQRLERFGLVEVAVGRYTRVSEIDTRLREDTGVFMAYFMGNVLQVTLRACSDEELSAIVDAADVVVSCADAADPLALFDSSVVMFELLTRASGNSVIIAIIRETSLSILRSLRGWYPFLAAPLENASLYVVLREQIASRDAAGAERTLRRLHGID